MSDPIEPPSDSKRMMQSRWPKTPGRDTVPWTDDEPPSNSDDYEPRPVEEHTPEFLAAADRAEAEFTAALRKVLATVEWFAEWDGMDVD